MSTRKWHMQRIYIEICFHIDDVLRVACSRCEFIVWMISLHSFCNKKEKCFKLFTFLSLFLMLLPRVIVSMCIYPKYRKILWFKYYWISFYVFKGIIFMTSPHDWPKGLLVTDRHCHKVFGVRHFKKCWLTGVNFDKGQNI